MIMYQLQSLEMLLSCDTIATGQYAMMVQAAMKTSPGQAIVFLKCYNIIAADANL